MHVESQRKSPGGSNRKGGEGGGSDRVLAEGER